MEQSPVGEMSWRDFSGELFKILHVRLNSFDVWRPYTYYPWLWVADYPDLGEIKHSRGMTTFHYLRSKGWKLL